MNFSEYCEYVRKYGHFHVALGDNWTKLEITDDACDLIFDRWLTPLIMAAEEVWVYRMVYKSGSRDVTPPPRRPKAIILTRVGADVKLDAKAMLADKYRAYWHWALLHTNITVLISSATMDGFAIEALAKESWDPAILTNLDAVATRGAIELAKREAAKQKVCFLFTHQSYNVECHMFAARPRLLQMYRCFVLNCGFVMKGLKQELLPERQKERKAKTIRSG
jgi:hypothetical protein